VKNNLSMLRKQKGLTQEELADKAGVTKYHISRIENGKIVGSLDFMIRVAIVLECSIDEIFLTNKLTNKSTGCSELIKRQKGVNDDKQINTKTIQTSKREVG
jgi:putative transcriptional regulator